MDTTPPERARYAYTVRMVSISENGEHDCGGRIVAVIQSTYNSDRRAWYLTALVERPIRP